MTCDNIASLKKYIKNKGRESWELSMVLNPDPSQLFLIDVRPNYQNQNHGWCGFTSKKFLKLYTVVDKFM